MDVSQPPSCRFCRAPLQDTFVDLGMSPLCESYVPAEHLDDMEPFYPLHVRICRACLLVQLPAYVSGEAIFSDYAYFSSYSDSWVAHARAYTDAISERLGLDAGSFVVEVASNDGYLLQHVVERGIRCLGIEPAANVAAAAVEKGVPTLVRFFGVDTAKEVVAEHGEADLVVGNNVFAHVPDLNDFTAGLALVAGDHGVVTLEVPNLVALIEGNQFDTIYHEHYSYFSVLTARDVLAAHGLRLFDVEELPTHGGSLRLYATRADEARHPTTAAVEAVSARARAAGLDTVEGHRGFAVRVEKVKHDLVEFLIDARRAGETVAAYGAPGKGNTLLNYCGIRADLLEYTVDRNPYKQGRFLPGTHIPIHAPEHLFEHRPDVVLVLPWNLREEIVGQLHAIREWGGRFAFPIPELEVV